MKEKIVVFTGAGVSKESGILTFRDSVDVDGLKLNNYKYGEKHTKYGKPIIVLYGW